MNGSQAFFLASSTFCGFLIESSFLFWKVWNQSFPEIWFSKGVTKPFWRTYSEIYTEASFLVNGKPHFSIVCKQSAILFSNSGEKTVGCPALVITQWFNLKEIVVLGISNNFAAWLSVILFSLTASTARSSCRSE